MTNADAVSREQWYYDITTGEVTRGKVHSWTGRMGPYESRAAAEHALDIARERNRQADAAEEDED